MSDQGAGPEQAAWVPLGEVLLGEATTLLHEADSLVAGLAESAAAHAKAEAQATTTLLRKLQPESAEHRAATAAREAAKAADARAAEQADVHRELVKALLDDLARLAGSG